MEYFFNFNKLDYVKNKKPSGCILCSIQNGDSSQPDLRVYTDPLFFVTLNLYPYNPGHIMVVPVRHIQDIRELTPEESKRLSALQAYFLDIMDKLHNPHGYNIGFNMGKCAGASIEHLHLHMIPRYPSEIGISDLIAGKRVLVEDPKVTAKRMKEIIVNCPFPSP
ncbi:MAG: HIT family protein [Spirochaetia bacterium]